MSLSTILNSYGFTSSGSSASTTKQAALVAAKLAAAKNHNTNATSSTATSSGTGTSVTISAAAKAANAAKADNAKDFTTLSKEVRDTLDKQYASGTAKGSPDLSGMSGRALAAIALNKNHTFSTKETLAAKTALRAQAQTEFTSAMSSGGGMAGLTTYSKQVVSEYDSMSSEERQARGWTEKFRSTNATFLIKTSSVNS